MKFIDNKVSSYVVSQHYGFSPRLGQNMFLGTHFQSPSARFREILSHTYKTRGKIMVIYSYILTHKCLNSRLEEKPNGRNISLYQSALNSSVNEFWFVMFMPKYFNSPTLSKSPCFLNSSSFKMGPTYCHEPSLRNYQYTLCYFPPERTTQLITCFYTVNFSCLLFTRHEHIVNSITYLKPIHLKPINKSSVLFMVCRLSPIT